MGGRGFPAIGALSLVILATGCGSGPPSIDRAHTNVLWLTLCSLRADHLGAYGHPGGLSPFLDSLAARGVLFERTLTAAPWTRASVAAMVSSVPPRSLGFQAAGPYLERALPDAAETLAERLHSAGYTTLGITANPSLNPSRNFQQGYDVYRGTDASGPGGRSPSTSSRFATSTRCSRSSSPSWGGWACATP
jgi:arylsulfatase A-like enzyme